MFRERILSSVESISAKFGNRLTFGGFGFAHDHGGTFELMQSMTHCAQASGSPAVFASGLDTQSLRKGLFTMATSLMATRAGLSSLAGGSQLRASVDPSRKKRTDLKKDVSKDRSEASDGADIIFSEDDHDFHSTKSPSSLNWPFREF